MRPYPMYRNLVLSDEITSESVRSVINKIMDINYDDDLKANDYCDWKREPIYLFINSNGGNAYDALALIDIIQQSKTPVYTVALGWCMSAGLWIFTAGARRLVGANATLMFHDVKTWIHDKTSGVQQELDEAKRLSEKFCDAIIAVSRIAPADLEHYITTKAEWYIPAEKAVNLKLADEIYSKDS